MEVRTVFLPVASEAGRCKIVPTGKRQLLSVQVMLASSVCVCVRACVRACMHACVHACVCACSSIIIIKFMGWDPKGLYRRLRPVKVLFQPNWEVW